MAKRFDKHISSIFVACREYYLANDEWEADSAKSSLLKKMEGSLKKTLVSMARIHKQEHAV